MNPVIVSVLVMGGACVLWFAGTTFMLLRCWIRVKPGQALVVHKPGGVRSVSLTGALVLPMIHSATLLDTTEKTVEIKVSGFDVGEVCAALTLRIGSSHADVLRAADRFGPRAGDAAAWQEALAPRVRSVLDTEVRAAPVADAEARAHVREAVRRALASDLDGLELVDVQITRWAPRA